MHNFKNENYDFEFSFVYLKPNINELHVNKFLNCFQSYICFIFKHILLNKVLVN